MSFRPSQDITQSLERALFPMGRQPYQPRDPYAPKTEPTLAPDPFPPPPGPPRWQPGDPLPPSVMPNPPGIFRPTPGDPDMTGGRPNPDFGMGGVNPNPPGVGRRPAPLGAMAQGGAQPMGPIGRQPQRPTYGALNGLLG